MADAIYLMVGGRKSYFQLCVDEAIALDITEPTEVVGSLRSGPHLQPLIDACSAGCSKDDLALARTIAILGCAPRQFLRAVGGEDVVDRLQAAGLPLVECEVGFALAPPLDLYFAPPEPLDDEAALTLGAQLDASCGTQRAAQLLVRAGYTNAAASIIRSIDLAAIDESHHGALGAMLTTILDVEKDDGSLGLLLARVHHNAGELDLQSSALAKAGQAAREFLRLDLAVEADAELLMVSLPMLGPDVAQERLAEIQKESQEHSTSHALVRLREISEALLLHTGDLATIYRSVSRVQAVAKQWEAIGEPARAAATLRMLVISSVNHLGQYSLGLQLMREARQLVQASPQALLRGLSLTCRMSALAGELDDYEEAAHEAQELCNSVGSGWLEAYLAWSAMIAAGHRGNASQVGLQLGRARELLDRSGLMDHPTGVVFWSDAARSLLSCGDLPGAEAAIEAMAGRSHEEPVEYALAHFVMMCRSEPDRAKQWAFELHESCVVPSARSWTVDLELLFATTPSPTSQQVTEIREAAAEHGLGALFESMRKALGSTSRFPRVFIRVFGPFAVEIDGSPVPIKSKRAVELLALLAVRGRPVHVEVAVDRLWPDATLEVGTTRLRNVIKRARKAVGADGVVRDGDMIRLGPEVRVDLHEAEARLRDFEVAPALNLESLNEALSMYRGAVLDEFLYADWVSAKRFEVSERIARAAEGAIADGLTSPASLAARLANSPSVGSPLQQVLAGSPGNQERASAQY